MDILDNVSKISQNIEDVLVRVSRSTPSVFVEYLSTIKIISGIISALLFGCIVYCIYKLGLVNRTVDQFIDTWHIGDPPRRTNIRIWRKTLKLASKKDPALWRQALKDADSILDEVLKIAGYQGGNIDERLQYISPAQIANIVELRQAHEFAVLVNKNEGIEITRTLVEEALYIYRTTFQELRLID